MSPNNSSFGSVPPASRPGSHASGSASLTGSGRAKVKLRWDKSTVISGATPILVRIRLEPDSGGLFHAQKKAFKGTDLLTSAAEAYALFIAGNSTYPRTADDPTLFKVSFYFFCFPHNTHFWW